MSSQPKLVYGQDQLASVIALYESYLIADVQSNLISQKEMKDKGNNFLEWANTLLGSKLRTINQITQRSIQIFKQISIDEVDISSKILQLEHESVQKNTAIENHLYAIKNLENKVLERDNDIEKMKVEINQLTQKIQKQQNRFKLEAKQFKKTFRQIQQNTESDKHILDEIQFEYEYQRQQKQIIKEQFDALIQEKAVIVKQLQETKRLLRASQNKLEWEFKKKMSLEDVIKQKNQMIEKLLYQIQDLKDTIKNPYQDIQEENLDEKQSEYISSFLKEVDKNLLSDEMALRNSFLSEADFDEDLTRKNSFRKSFEQRQPNGSQNQFQQQSSPNQNNITLNARKSDYVIENHPPLREKLKTNKSSFHHQNIVIKVQEKPLLTSTIKSADQSPTSILIRDMQKTPVVSLQIKSQLKGAIKGSPEVNQFTAGTHPKQDELQIITQKVQSETQSSAGPFRRNVRNAPDLYFAHFLLTSQAVKIKEDCEEILAIDVKQYYHQIIQKRVPMHIWDDWIRDKLRTVVKGIKMKR